MNEISTVQTYRAYRAVQGPDGVRGGVEELEFSALPQGEVTVRVAYSSLNYKDALSARGRPGVTRHYPHTPGIDAAGTVVTASSEKLKPGDKVIVSSYDLGMDTPGGFGEYIRVPEAWVVPLPSGLTLRSAMILGTAGFTAGLALAALLRQGLSPQMGPVVVTGASGGVGSLAVALLNQNGFDVIASSGTQQAHEWLRKLGARQVMDRGELGEPNGRPLLSASYAGGIDTVGGDTLANLLKSTKYGGAVAACGLVQSPDLNVNVYPFILRSVSLLGIDSANTPMELRRKIWGKLADPWRLPNLDTFAVDVELDDLDPYIDRILEGDVEGRVVVRVAGE